MAMPRLVVANFVNFIASMHAIRIYLGHTVTGKPLVWDKTAHSYPITLRRDGHLTLESNRAIENVALNVSGRQFGTRLNKEIRPPEMPIAGEREHEATHV
jgi:hypothetical protein